MTSPSSGSVETNTLARIAPTPGTLLSADPASVSTSSTWPLDDHSRYAYAEALLDERGVSAAAFLVRALAHFGRSGIAVERILTDNGACYVSRIFTDTAAARNIRLKRTRPFRPQTNGKAEAFNKIMQAEWAYQRPYYSNRKRLDALPGFLAYYNHRRPHGGIGGTTPTSACKQRPWELQLDPRPRPPFPPVESCRTTRRPCRSRSPACGGGVTRTTVPRSCPAGHFCWPLREDAYLAINTT